MQIGINLRLPRSATAGLGGGDPASALFALDPSLVLDFITGPASSLGSYQDASLDLNFLEPQYDIAATADPAYGYGRYLVAG
jgi:hypothetical protein